MECQRAKYKHWHLIGTHRETDIEFRRALKSIEYSFKSEYIKPIPLTTDILTNNGFTQDTIGSGLILHIDNSENLYVLVNYRHNGECRNVEISNKMYNLLCPIQYVHELQHALRLCGLSELAENLKVL